MIEITAFGQKTMKENNNLLNYYIGLIQSEAKTKNVKIAVKNSEESEGKVEAPTTKVIAEILERVERKTRMSPHGSTLRTMWMTTNCADKTILVHTAMALKINLNMRSA